MILTQHRYCGMTGRHLGWAVASGEFGRYRENNGARPASTIDNARIEIGLQGFKAALAAFRRRL